ncbi:DUF6249 domain-containing protein [Aerolutibacter ruishenii]|uniref:DUF6249 domain-containing protein n=1 Tax=Aerolutibacter ruishenii TaxID=686800 RepID=A0A562LRT9_9GAMM|nr:DUF6249 domain-containing protein [Lysobacter ruishenii]TWI10258.1 hypothetical protein IP93_01836 [Lysobacter ruishenii]
MNNLELLIPITLFVCIVYAIKVVVDARTRAKLIANNVSEELMQAMLAGEEHNRRHGSLRWGIVLTALAIGFFVIEAAGWTEVTPGVIGVLLAVTGLGNLGFYMTSRKLR